MYTMGKGKPIPLRFDDEVLARIERLERLYSAQLGGDMKVSRSEVLRLVVARGLTALETELDWSALPASDRPKPKKPKR